MAVVDVHTKFLREQGYPSLVEWLEDPDHVYIGRSMGWVKGAVKSKWANPFTVKKYGLSEALRLYEEHVRATLMPDLEELRGKTLGCWCVGKGSETEDPEGIRTQRVCCHGQVLLRLLRE